MHQHPYPACPSCRGTSFLSLPDVAIHIGLASTTLGLPSSSPRGFLAVTLVICQGCGHLDAFAKDTQRLSALFPGGAVFQATGQPGSP